jgi:hypothetical protein
VSTLATVKEITNTYRKKAENNCTFRACIVFAILCLLIFLRRPDRILVAQPWAEDGPIFIDQALMNPVSAFITPFNGYLHFVPRIITVISLLAGMTRTPLLMDVSSLVISASCVSFLALKRFRVLVRNDWLRYVLCVLIVSLPITSGEVLLNITNIQWFMIIYLTLWTMDQWLNYDTIKTRNFTLSLFESSIATITQLTTVYGFLLIPVLFWIGLKRLRTDGLRAADTGLVLMPIIGCSLQFLVFTKTTLDLSTIPRPIANLPPTIITIQLISSIITKLVYAKTFSLFETFGFIPMYLVAAAAIALFVIFLVRFRECRMANILLLFLFGCSVLATSIFRGGYASNTTLFLLEGDRYIFYPLTLMLIGLVTNLQYLRRRWGHVFGVVLLVLVIFNCASHFSIAPLPDFKFQSYAQYYNSNSSSLIYAPTQPFGWFTSLPASPEAIASEIMHSGLVQGRGSFIIDFATSDGKLLDTTHSTISVNKTNTVFVFLTGEVSGIIDPVNAFIVVDNIQAFPTAFGIDWMGYWGEAPPGWDRSGCMGTITVTGLSTGSHEISIWILAGNGTYYTTNTLFVLSIYQ